VVRSESSELSNISGDTHVKGCSGGCFEVSFLLEQVEVEAAGLRLEVLENSSGEL